MYKIPTSAYLSEKDNIVWANDKCLDDRNQPGELLAYRRLVTPHKKYPIKVTRRNIAELLLDVGSCKYIDSKGLVFTYKKTAYYKLITHSIRGVVKKVEYSIIYLNGIPFPFASSSIPPDRCYWARVIHRKGIPWFIYQFSPKFYEPTIKKL